MIFPLIMLQMMIPMIPFKLDYTKRKSLKKLYKSYNIITLWQNKQTVPSETKCDKLEIAL